LNEPNKVIGLKNLFKEIFNKEIKIKIMVDNKACIAIAQDINSIIKEMAAVKIK